MLPYLGEVIRVGSYFNDQHPYNKKREIWTQKRTEGRQYEVTEERSPDDRGRDQSYVAESQGMPKIPGHYQKLGEARKDAPLEPC